MSRPGVLKKWSERVRRIRHRPRHWRRPRPRTLVPQTLLLTATISPPKDAWRLARTDPDVRRDDYRKALEWYLSVDSSVVSNIVFVENSNSDLADFEALAKRHGTGKDVEILSVYGMDHPSTYTRGYGEFKLIDRTLAASRILQSIGPEGTFWKITGRYRVQNLKALFENAPASYAIYADVRLTRRYFDTRVFAATIEGYHRYFLGMFEKFDKRRCEDVLFDELMPRAYEMGFVGAMNVSPMIDGVAATDNRTYDSGFWRFTRAGRMVVNRALPFLWL
jgi:hypothetical protein